MSLSPPGGTLRLEHLKSRLQNVKLLAMCHEHLTTEQEIELMQVIDETLDIIENFSGDSHMESEIYEQFFDGLRKLPWLKF